MRCHSEQSAFGDGSIRPGRPPTSRHRGGPKKRREGVYGHQDGAQGHERGQVQEENGHERGAGASPGGRGSGELFIGQNRCNERREEADAELGVAAEMRPQPIGRRR